MHVWCLEADRHVSHACQQPGSRHMRQQGCCLEADRHKAPALSLSAARRPPTHQGSRAGTAASCDAAHLWRMGSNTTGCMQALLPQSGVCVRSSTCICSMQCVQQAWPAQPCLLQALHGHAGTLKGTAEKDPFRYATVSGNTCKQQILNMQICHGPRPSRYSCGACDLQVNDFAALCRPLL